MSKFLTIGMPTYDDYEGAVFTINAIRTQYPELDDLIEFLLIDDNPKGDFATLNRKIFDGKKIPGGRYVANEHWVGPWLKGRVFQEASAPYVLVLDSHVLLWKDAVARLIEYYRQNPQTNDLLQGPLVYCNMKSISTHFHPRWSGHMWGQWATDSRGYDLDGEPFDIWAQGMGLFSARRDRWLEVGGFHPLMRGFGGEEGYIHEKFRQAGGRTLCLPFLRWWHRFNRLSPEIKMEQGKPTIVWSDKKSRYPLTAENKFRNYVIGFTELGLDTEPIIKHFSQSKSREFWEKRRDAAVQEFRQFQEKTRASSLPDADVQQIPQVAATRRGSFTFVFDTGLPGQDPSGLQRLSVTDNCVFPLAGNRPQPIRPVQKPG